MSFKPDVAGVRTTHNLHTTVTERFRNTRREEMVNSQTYKFYKNLKLDFLNGVNTFQVGNSTFFCKTWAKHTKDL